MVKTILTVSCLVWISFNIGNKTGQEYQKEIGLEKCKEAGWEFVDDILIDLKAPEEKMSKIKMYLQSKIATKCISRFE